MVKVDANQTTNISFGLNTSGPLKVPPITRLVIPISEDIQLCFLGNVNEEQKNSDFEIPPLSQFLQPKTKVIKDAVFEVLVEGNVNGRKVKNVFEPWKGDIKIEESVIVESSEPIVKQEKNQKSSFFINNSTPTVSESDLIDDNDDYV